MPDLFYWWLALPFSSSLSCRAQIPHQRALQAGPGLLAVGGVAELEEPPGGAVIGCGRGGRRGRGERRGETELRGDVTLVGAGPGRAACDAAAAAEPGINGKSFGRSRRILRSLRDGGGASGGCRDRSVRVRGSG